MTMNMWCLWKLALSKPPMKCPVTTSLSPKRNYCITSLNLSWNGFGVEGAIALAELIRGNKYLRELDISHNRINWEGAIAIAKALKENDTLETLQIGHNILTMTGCLDLGESVDSQHSVISFIGLHVCIYAQVLYNLLHLYSFSGYPC